MNHIRSDSSSTRVPAGPHTTGTTAPGAHPTVDAHREVGMVGDQADEISLLPLVIAVAARSHPIGDVSQLLRATATGAD